MIANDKKMDWKAMVGMLRETYGNEEKQMSKDELKGAPPPLAGEGVQSAREPQ